MIMCTRLMWLGTGISGWLLVTPYEWTFGFIKMGFSSFWATINFAKRILPLELVTVASRCNDPWPRMWRSKPQLERKYVTLLYTLALNSNVEEQSWKLVAAGAHSGRLVAERIIRWDNDKQSNWQRAWQTGLPANLFRSLQSWQLIWDNQIANLNTAHSSQTYRFQARKPLFVVISL
jgi:hypothetical protein